MQNRQKHGENVSYIYFTFITTVFLLHCLRLVNSCGMLCDDGDHDDYNDCTTILLWWCL